jgi:acyl-coenzyme A thioesterase PaaI-like protein
MGTVKNRLNFLKKDTVQGFTEYIGLIPVSLAPGEFTTQIKLREHHIQQDGFVHAGVIATMADHTAGYAAYSLVPESHRILTIEYKINWTAPL